ncbi:vitelline envelope sperm lysin receptor-like [Mytilus edulis]|uniref:vitelline envelope sperm lysin receptor-like n=1 Tax=Mytilus edulis TaxID=6550 RepID=UPI0039F098AD
MFNCCLLLLLLLKIADGQEDEYYINVEAKCPESILNPPAVITVTADLPSSKPFAVCANGEFLFTMDNFGSYSLPVVFETNATLTCAFYQKSLAADVYSVSVYIPLSERVITIDIPEKIVTCIYDPIGDKETSVQQLEESKVPVKQIEQHLAETSQSTINICVADLNNNCITGNILIGKIVKLKAVLVGNSSDEQGFQALSCSATGTSYKYPILTAGCGQGSLFKSDAGFITTGKVALSPVFEMFRTAGGNTMKYDCSFVVCRTPCDGSSCKSKSTRKKRDTYAVREPHYSETIYIPKDKVLEAKPYLDGDTLQGLEIQALEQQDGYIKDKLPGNPDNGHLIKKGNEEPAFKEDERVPEQNDVRHPTKKILSEESIWSKEIIVILMLAFLIMLFMAITVKVLLGLNRSMVYVQNEIARKETLPQLKLIS